MSVVVGVCAGYGEVGRLDHHHTPKNRRHDRGLSRVDTNRTQTVPAQLAGDVPVVGTEGIVQIQRSKAGATGPDLTTVLGIATQCDGRTGVGAGEVIGQGQFASGIDFDAAGIRIGPCARNIQIVGLIDHESAALAVERQGIGVRVHG